MITRTIKHIAYSYVDQCYEEGMKDALEGNPLRDTIKVLEYFMGYEDAKGDIEMEDDYWEDEIRTEGL